MSISTGDQFGSYEIVSTLGAGGMGVVYRARDTRLRRDVALKVLPAFHASSLDRMARFEREAVALAALKHPNIGAIYGLQDIDGTPALVLELVEGETLADRLTRGPVPLDDALAIARQVASGLEAAHERGIVHRDIKPGNIQLLPDGAVKVLDFGLAKLVEPGDVTPVAALEASPTVTSPAVLTGAGVVLGTAPYASPEQVKGQATDRRSDVWAFGCVLYEMLTGTRAFPGGDVTDVIAAVLKSDPDWNPLPANTPLAISTLLRRCLRKERSRRLADIADARIEIEDVLAAPPTAPDTRAHNGTLARVAAILTVLASLTTAVWALWPSAVSAPMSAPSPLLRVDPGADVVFGPSTGLSQLALSPDGTTLAFAAQPQVDAPRQVYVRRLHELDARPLPGTDGANNLFFSPDGTWIGFASQNQLRRVPLAGGTVTPIAPVSGPAGATWLPDDTIVYQPFSLGGNLKRVPAAGGTPVDVTRRAAGENIHRWPQGLPGGRSILFSVARAGVGDEGEIVVQSLETGERRTVHRGGSHARYLASGHLVFVRNATLFAALFDLDSLALTSDPVPVVSGVSSNGVEGTAQYTVSDSGVLAFLPSRATPDGGLPIHWLDSTGQTSRLFPELLSWGTPRFSHDGQQLAVTIGDTRPGGVGTDIWVIDIKRGLRTKVTQDPGSDVVPIFTPDDSGVIFASTRHGGPSNLYWKRADGIGEAYRLTTSPSVQFPASVHPSGGWIAVQQGVPPEPSQVVFVPIRSENGRITVTGEKPLVLAGGNFRLVQPAFSPDGRWVAFVSNESGGYTVFVRPFPALDHQVHVSIDRAADPRWSRTSNDLLFTLMPESIRSTGAIVGHAGGRIMAARYRVVNGRFESDVPRPWSDGEVAFTPVGAQIGGNVDLHPDGRRLAVASPVAKTAAATGNEQVVMMYEFFEEIRRRLAGTN